MQIFNTKKIIVFDLPISINDNDATSRAVADYLKRFDFVVIICPEYMCNTYKIGVEKKNYNNFYFDVDTTFDRFNSNKWLKKSKMNTFVSTPGFDFKYMSSNDCVEHNAEIKNLIKTWCTDTQRSVNPEKYMENIARCGNDFLYIAIFYDGKMLSLEPIIIRDGYVFSIGFFHIGRSRDVFYKNQKVRTVCGHLSDISEYYIIQHLKRIGIKRFYAEGSRPDNSSLYEHKLNRYDGHIKYFQVV